MFRRILVLKVYFLLNSRTAVFGMQGDFMFCYSENLYANTPAVNVTIC